MSRNRYSYHARRALTHAQLLTTRFHHPRVDTGHLLVGVMMSKGSLGHTTLADFAIDPDAAARELEQLTMPLDNQVEDPPYDAALDIALELAADESTWLGHHYIGTEHFLLGVTRTNVGNASDLLRELNIAPAQVRNRLRRLLHEGVTEFNLEWTRRDASVSELSRRVMNAAEQLAVRRDDEWVGIGHLLLALIRERRSFIRELLQRQRLDETQILALFDADRDLAMASIEPVIRSALLTAQDMGSHFTGTEHLLTALVSHDDGRAMFQTLHIAPEAIESALRDRLARKR